MSPATFYSWTVLTPATHPTAKHKGEYVKDLGFTPNQHANPRTSWGSSSRGLLAIPKNRVNPKQNSTDTNLSPGSSSLLTILCLGPPYA